MKKISVIIILIMLLGLMSIASASALCVITEDANLRSGPGTKYEKTWQVFKYMPLKKLGKKGKWYRVRDVDGDEHWVYEKLVTEKFRCAVVKVDKANIRRGPGIKYRKTDFSPVIKYDSFRIIKKKGLWYKVKDEFGQVGWIHKKLIWIQ